MTRSFKKLKVFHFCLLLVIQFFLNEIFVLPGREDRRGLDFREHDRDLLRRVPPFR